MPPSSPPPPSLRSIAFWSVLAPIIGLWPFLSAMPAFTLVGGNFTAASGWLNALMLGTGFWAVAPAAAALWWSIPANRRGEAREAMLRWRSPLATLAVVWTLAYTTIAFLGY